MPTSGFLSLQPVVERHARIQFRHLPPERQEEAIAEAMAAAFVSYTHVVEQGKDPAAFPSTLASYAVLHAKQGRHVGGSTSSRDVLSPTAQHRRGFAVHRLPAYQGFLDEVLADDSQTPVPDQVAFRLDFPAFLTTLTDRDHRMIQLLAQGEAAVTVAGRFGLTPGRLTQLRQQWRRDWGMFIRDEVAA